MAQAILLTDPHVFVMTMCVFLWVARHGHNVTLVAFEFKEVMQNKPTHKLCFVN